MKVKHWLLFTQTFLINNLTTKLMFSISIVSCKRIDYNNSVLKINTISKEEQFMYAS